jgi:hypothetical protein
MIGAEPDTTLRSAAVSFLDPCESLVLPILVSPHDTITNIIKEPCLALCSGNLHWDRRKHTSRVLITACASAGVTIMAASMAAPKSLKVGMGFFRVREPPG